MNNNSYQFQVRRKFSLVLKPIKILLLSKKNTLSKDDWFRFVQQTKESILKNPEEYLGNDLPDSAMIEDTVEFIFRDFLMRSYHNSKIIEIRMNAYRSKEMKA
jgi:hypothetical protein